MITPVADERIEYASEVEHIQNAGAAAVACRRAGLPYYAACALLEKETHGANIYGHDAGGMFSTKDGAVTILGTVWPRGWNIPVNGINYHLFITRVMNGALSNGVGPCQITYAGSLKDGHRDGGYFRQMAEKGLRPWVVVENMEFGFSILAKHYSITKSWAKAGRLYNGKESYGADLAVKVAEWQAAFRRLG